MFRNVLDPLGPRIDDRRADDLGDVDLVRVVRAERPLTILSEAALEQAPEVRLNRPPIEIRRTTKHLQLLTLEMNPGGSAEKAAVCVRHPRVEAGARPARSRVVEKFEEPTEIVRAGASRRGQKSIDHARESVRGEHREILREHAPDRLQDEVAQHIGLARLALAEAIEQARKVRDRIARDRNVPAGEDRLAIGQESRES